MARVARSPKPQHHAEGKPVRGIRGPGVRGPNKHQDEIDAERDPANRPIQIHYSVKQSSEYSPRLNVEPAPDSTLKVRGGRSAGKELSRLIQLIGDEQIDPNSVTNHWTRIEAVVRRLYTEAMLGKTSAALLLFERGWGRVPMPVKVDFTTEMTRVLDEAGLTQADIERDPLLLKLIQGPAEGRVVENDDRQNQPTD